MWVENIENQVWDESLKSIKKLEIEYFISKRIYIYITLRFLDKYVVSLIICIVHRKKIQI